MLCIVIFQDKRQGTEALKLITKQPGLRYVLYCYIINKKQLQALADGYMKRCIV